MNIEEAKNSIGKEVYFTSKGINELSDFWKREVKNAHRIIISEQVSLTEFKLEFIDRRNYCFQFWIVDFNKIDIELATNREGMTIEEARLHVGAEIVLLEHTKPYMKGVTQSIANLDSNLPPSKLTIDKISGNTVVLKSPEKHSYILNPEHIALRVIENINIENVVIDTPSSNKEALNSKIDHKKPVHEWNIDDAFYANNHGEEVEVFDTDEWVLLDEITVGHARSRTQFRIKPKPIFIKSGTYYEEDLIKIINDNFKK